MSSFAPACAGKDVLVPQAAMNALNPVIRGRWVVEPAMIHERKKCPDVALKMFRTWAFQQTLRYPFRPRRMLAVAIAACTAPSLTSWINPWRWTY
jgi:hypothetical protein